MKHSFFLRLIIGRSRLIGPVADRQQAVVPQLCTVSNVVRADLVIMTVGRRPLFTRTIGRFKERLMASQNGGHLTRQEQNTLNQQENATR